MGNESSRTKNDSDSDEEDDVVEAPSGIYDAIFKKNVDGNPGAIQSILETMSCEPLLCGNNRIDKEERVCTSGTKPPDMNTWAAFVPDVDTTSPTKSDSSTNPLAGTSISIADDLDELPGQGYTVRQRTQQIEPLFSEPLPESFSRDKEFRVSTHQRSFYGLDQLDASARMRSESVSSFNSMNSSSMEPKTRVYHGQKLSRSSSFAEIPISRSMLSKPPSQASLYYDTTRSYPPTDSSDGSISPPPSYTRSPGDPEIRLHHTPRKTSRKISSEERELSTSREPHNPLAQRELEFSAPQKVDSKLETMESPADTLEGNSKLSMGWSLARVGSWAKSKRETLMVAARKNQPDPQTDPAMHTCIQTDDLASLRTFLFNNTNINTRDESGATPIHYAVQYERMEILQTLVQAGADINAQNNAGLTALYAAVLVGNNAIVAELLQKGADPNKKLVVGTTCLHAASQMGNLVMVQQLVGAEAMLDATDPNGVTPMHAAAQQGHLDVVKCLVEIGASYDLPTKFGVTPLHVVARKGHLDVFLYLVSQGVNLDATTQRGATPLYVAVQNGHIELVDALLKAGADMITADAKGTTPLHVAVNSGNPKLVESLLGACYWKGDLKLTDAADQRGGTPLHLAAAKGNEELVILLLSVEADVNLADKKGLTALHLAAQTGSASVIQTLADASADIDAVDRTDSTALHIAADHGQLSCVEVLVKAGCNIDRVDMHGATALIRCIKQAPLNSAQGLHIAVLHALLKAGAVVDASYMRGTTALHIAAQKGHKEIIEALIKYGADRRVKDENGETPSDLAKRNKLLTLLTLLT